MRSDYQQYIHGTKAILPFGMSYIDDSAFEDCTGLTSIEIPNSVTSIGALAFEGCKSLTSIEIPSSVNEIGNHAFEDCARLTSIKLHIEQPTEAQNLLEASALKDLYKISLFTPIGTAFAYKHNNFFRRFKEVIPTL